MRTLIYCYVTNVTEQQ